MQPSMSDQYFSDFPAALRYWRTRRGLSQLELSTIGAVSQRHLSFLERGRSQPSKEIILKLGQVLDVPLRQRNAMLLAAGFAPAYQERQLADPELAPVRQALDFMLAQQAPFPALIVDRLWNLQLSNAPAKRLFRWLLELPPDAPIADHGALSVPRLMLSPDALRPFIANAGEVCADMLHWIQREAMSDGAASPAAQLLEELKALESASGAPATTPERTALPFMPLQLRKGGVELNLFTTIATLGTPRDVTLHELRIESFFAADGATEQWFRAQDSH
ncbi:MAG: helix-turn-helix domain-containing protein [Gammaproteobacteria bacterium]